MSDYVPELSDGVDDDTKTEEGYTGGIAYFYDQSTPPTLIESIFGEPYHISDKYASHQITWSLILTLMLESIVTGSILWLEIAFRYYLISLWSIGPSQFTEILCIIQIPFTIRILYGLLIDTVSCFGYRRKSYLFLFGIIAILSSFGLIYYKNSFIIQILCLCVRSFSIAFCDVIIQAITVERSEYKPHTVAIRLQSLNYFSMYVISSIGLIIAAKIEETQTPNHIIYVYWMYFGITFLIIIGSILLPENKYNKNKNKNKNKNNENENDEIEYGMVSNIDDEDDIDIDDIQQLEPPQQFTGKQILSLTFETFCRKSIFYPLLFTFLIAAMPRSNQVIDYYLMYNLKFSSHKIGYLQIISSIAFIISVIIITIHSKSTRFSLRFLFGIWTFISAIIPYSSLILIFGINKSFFHISDFIYSILNRLIIRITVDMLLLATAVLYARICPPGIEGVFFTLLTSIATIGEIISYFLTSLFINLFNIQCAKIQYPLYYGLNIHNPEANAQNLQCDFTNLWLFIIAINLTSLIPLMWIFWIPNENEMQYIAITLRESAINKLTSTTNNNNNNNNNTNNEDNDDDVNDNDMILFYFICVEYVFPFLSFCCPCCLSSNKNYKIKNKNHNNGQYIL